MPGHWHLPLYVMRVTDKSGCEPDEAFSIVSHILESCKQLEFVGLMTIGAIDSQPIQTDASINPDFQASNLSLQPA